MPDSKVSTKGISYGYALAPHNLIIYYSPGCSHCVHYLRDHFAKDVHDLVNDKKLFIRLIELPNLVGVPPKKGQSSDEYGAAVRQAQQHAVKATIMARCIAELKDKAAYLKMMQSLSDPNAKDDAFWSNLETKEANQAIYKAAFRTGLSRQEVTKCASASTEERIFPAILQQTKERPKEVTSVPFFIFDGKQFNLPNARRKVVGLSIKYQKEKVKKLEEEHEMEKQKLARDKKELEDAKAEKKEIDRLIQERMNAPNERIRELDAEIERKQRQLENM